VVQKRDQYEEDTKCETEMDGEMKNRTKGCVKRKKLHFILGQSQIHESLFISILIYNLGNNKI
jgi:hypothetical protein